MHSYVLALDITTNRNTNMDTHLVNNITYIIQNGYIHATNTVSHRNPTHHNTHTNTTNIIYVNSAVETFILTMLILHNIHSNSNVNYKSLMAIRMLVLITFHIQRKPVVLPVILGTSIADANLNNGMSINTHIGTNIHTTTNSHIHIDFGSNTIGHDHIDTKTSIHNSAITNVHTNTGDLSLSYRPMT